MDQDPANPYSYPHGFYPDDSYPGGPNSQSLTISDAGSQQWQVPTGDYSQQLQPQAGYSSQPPQYGYAQGMTSQNPTDIPPSSWTYLQGNAPGASTQPTNLNQIPPVPYQAYNADTSQTVSPRALSSPPGPLPVPSAYVQFLQQVQPRLAGNSTQTTGIHTLGSAPLVQNTSLAPPPAQGGVFNPVSSTAHQSQVTPVSWPPLSDEEVKATLSQMTSRIITKDGQRKLYYLYNRKLPGSILCSHPIHPPGVLHWLKPGEAFVTSPDQTSRYSADCWASCRSNGNGTFTYIPHALPWTLSDIQGGIDRSAGCEGMTVGVASVLSFPPKACPSLVHNAIELNSFRKDGWYWGADGDMEAKDIMCTGHMVTATKVKDPSWLAGAVDMNSGRAMRDVQS